MARASKMLRVIDRDIRTKSATKMLAAFLTFSLLVGAQCIPLEQQLKEQNPPSPAVLQQEQPKEAIPAQPLPHENVPSQENPESPLPLPGALAPAGGALPPGDLAESPDGNPVDRSGTSDLDTDATFWGGYGGWGGYRPYYGYGWSSPWRRWSGYGWGGRGYGWGGWGWGGRGWGWGGRGWGWGGRYWG